jgi:sec-independent protein translocase protein TatA
MGGLSLPHLLVVALLVLVLFGRGRISEMMGDFGKGIKSFKRGIDEEFEAPAKAEQPLRLGHDQDSRPAHAATKVPQPASASAPLPTPGPHPAASVREDAA